VRGVFDAKRHHWQIRRAWGRQARIHSRRPVVSVGQE
jgi:hypothetical protein